MSERATAKLEEVNRKLGQLEQIRTALETLIAACPGTGALRTCSIMEVLTDAEKGDNGVGRKERPST